VVTVKKEVGRILDHNGDIYPELFKDDTSAVWVCRAVRVYRFLDPILTANEIGEEKLFYKHMRYFVLHILARRSRVLRKPELDLSDADKLELSRELNDLATLIFNEVQSFRAIKGYLALSRNLTDMVQLAQRVMAAIATRDQTATTAAVAPSATPISPSPQPPATI
jgi:hypothetical protein